jgi:hypothetical protein
MEHRQVFIRRSKKDLPTQVLSSRSIGTGWEFGGCPGEENGESIQASLNNLSSWLVRKAQQKKHVVPAKA